MKNSKVMQFACWLDAFVALLSQLILNRVEGLRVTVRMDE